MATQLIIKESQIDDEKLFNRVSRFVTRHKLPISVEKCQEDDWGDKIEVSGKQLYCVTQSYIDMKINTDYYIEDWEDLQKYLSRILGRLIGYPHASYLYFAYGSVCESIPD